MENTIKIFENEEFGRVRTLTDENGKILFCGTDIARALGYANPQKAVRDHCKSGAERNVQHPQSENKMIFMKFIPEGDVYRLVVHSRLPSAEKFESWIFDEVLPIIRKTGGYVANAHMFVDNYLSFADEPIKNLFKLQFQYIGQLQKRIEHDKPLVEFAEQVANTENLIDMNEMAKLAREETIPIGRNRLFGWLRSKNILMGNNLPYQRFIDRGYYAVKESVFETGFMSKTYQQTCVTGKGQRFVIRLLKKYYGKEVDECSDLS